MAEREGLEPSERISPFARLAVGGLTKLGLPFQIKRNRFDFGASAAIGPVYSEYGFPEEAVPGTPFVQLDQGILLCVFSSDWAWQIS